MSVIQFLFNPQDLFDVIIQGSLLLFIVIGSIVTMFPSKQKSR